MADTIVRLESGNRAEVWKFWFYERRSVLVLTEYRVETRQSPRHKWRWSGWYDRLNQRDRSIKDERDVPLPGLVRELALTSMTLRVRVVKWAEVEND
jgi:hypothetical protein